MPPKKSTAGPGTRRGARASRAKPKNIVEDDDVNKIVQDDNKVVEKDEIKVVEENHEIKTVQIHHENKSESKKEDSVKESVDEYERDERLDLDDNEPEYEPEGYGSLDYDEKETDPDDVQEDGEDVEEEGEDDHDLIGHENIDESEGDADQIGHENVVAHEEPEDGDVEEHAREENRDMMDAEKQEHHDVVQERRKRKELEIFVGGLDKEATEDDLRKVFSKVGEVTEVRLMMNPQTKKNKGFAFLRFATVEQAKRACAEMKTPLVNGKKCGVTPSQDNDTLFLGNICKTWTKVALQDKLKHYGVVNVEDVTLVEDGNNEGFNRGFAFLEFSSKSEAKDAFKILQGNVVFGVDKPAKVSFADSFIDPGDEIMAQVKTVFVDALPASWDEDRVKELLKGFGHIEKIELARNMPHAKRKDFGFVTFDTHDAAVNCAKSINNQDLGEGETKVKVRARLSRPHQKGQGKHASRDYRPARGPARSMRAPWSRIVPRSLPVRGVRGSGSRLPPLPNRGMKRPAAFRDRRPVMSRPVRGRPLSPPPRSYERRPPVPVYPKGPIKRDYARRDEPPPRGRAPPEYASRPISERRPSYREEYSPRGSGGVSGYSDFSRSASRSSARRPYVDEGYGPKYERPPPSYREGRGRDYDAVSGTKRSYSAIDDIPPRYADTGVRQPRARLDYELGASGSHYGDAYNDRLGRSSLGYGSRTSLSSQDSHGLYGSRHGMSYSGSSVGGSDGGGMYSSSYGGDYVSSRGPDVGSGSYSSLYSSRGLSGSSYMGSGSSGSYY